MSFKKYILTIRHIAGNIMTSIETENTSNKIQRQYASKIGPWGKKVENHCVK
jgi:hypothetical protein